MFFWNIPKLYIVHRNKVVVGVVRTEYSLISITVRLITLESERKSVEKNAKKNNKGKEYGQRSFRSDQELSWIISI